MIEQVKERVPANPGCYIYYNKDNVIIYVGKAKNLKKRMSSYFLRVHDIKTTKLVSEIDHFEYIITNSEVESLILENQLIKKHMPKYNISLKDDKTYPYIVITDEMHPRILKVRDKKVKGTYYGPFPSNTFVNIVLKLLNRETKLRKCKNLPNKACIYYDLDQCYAPCIQDVLNKPFIDEAKKFFANDMKNIEKLIHKYMMIAASNLEFEIAQQYKVMLDQFSEFSQKQIIDIDEKVNVSAIEVYQDGSWVSICIIDITNGNIENIHTVIEPVYDDYVESVISYLYNYYNGNIEKNILCNDIVINKNITDVFIAKASTDTFVYQTSILKMAKINAMDYYKNNVEKLSKLISEDRKNGFNELQIMTNNNLGIIESYDISHIAGDSNVGVKVAYKDGKKLPKLYRKFKIRESKNDEYNSMRELLDRRINNMINDNEDFPNLIILDGGKGQMTIAKEVLSKYGVLDDIMVIGLVKNDKHQTEAIINKNYERYELDKKSKLYKFLYDVQEEVHRFAIDFHRKARSNNMFISELDKIQGLGPKRKKSLITEFQSVENIKKASIEDLINAGMPKNIASNIKAYFEANN